ncbi:TonB-dependent receptor [Massilia sp. B-10]|nr:TonB-dependent receptor [Massilia sp. B-10]
MGFRPFRTDDHEATPLPGSGQKGTPSIHIGGANLNGRHVTKLEQGADLSVQFILDHTERNQPGAFHEKLNTFDLGMQHNVRMGGRHRFSWGGGYRYSMDRIVNANSFAFLPGKLNLHWGNLFAQDEIALNAAFKVTAGVKAEHNSYTGLEYLPNLRVAWNSGASRLLWASIARSVRAPSRVDRDLHVPVKAPFFLGGGPDFISETVDVTELGYRAQASARFSYSATLFEARYDKLATLEKGRLSVLEYRNLGKGISRGLEAWGRWQPIDTWRLSGGFTVQRIDTSLYPGSRGEAGFSFKPGHGRSEASLGVALLAGSARLAAT